MYGTVLEPLQHCVDPAPSRGRELQSSAQLMGEALSKLQPHRIAAGGIESLGKSNAVVLDDHAYCAALAVSGNGNRSLFAVIPFHLGVGSQRRRCTGQLLRRQVNLLRLERCKKISGPGRD